MDERGRPISERIARELHEALLQSARGLILVFQGFTARVRDPVPTRAEIEAVFA
jgi:hypothetical protein